MVGLILAGGAGVRFPGTKALIEVDGSTLIKRNLAMLRSLCETVCISTNTPETYFSLGAPMVGDVVPPSGPLGGIYSTLLATEAEAVFVMACDMPYPSAALARLLMEMHGAGGHAATAPMSGGRPEPLYAVYGREAMDAMRTALDGGDFSMTGLLRRIGARCITEEAVRRADPEGRSFININTPEDFARAFGRLPNSPDTKG